MRCCRLWGSPPPPWCVLRQRRCRLAQQRRRFGREYAAGTPPMTRASAQKSNRSPRKPSLALLAIARVVGVPRVVPVPIVVGAVGASRIVRIGRVARRRRVGGALRRALPVLTGGRLRRRAAGRPLDDLVQLAAVQPDAAARRAVVDLDSLPLRHLQNGLILGTLHAADFMRPSNTTRAGRVSAHLRSLGVLMSVRARALLAVLPVALVAIGATACAPAGRGADHGDHAHRRRPAPTPAPRTSSRP